jgi:hypothetical protein
MSGRKLLYPTTYNRRTKHMQCVHFIFSVSRDSSSHRKPASAGDLNFVFTLPFTLPHFAQKCRTAINHRRPQASYAIKLPFSEYNKTIALHCSHKPNIRYFVKLISLRLEMSNEKVGSGGNTFDSFSEYRPFESQPQTDSLDLGSLWFHSILMYIS